MKIKQLAGQGLTTREIERVFNRTVSRSTISRVLRGLTRANSAPHTLSAPTKAPKPTQKIPAQNKLDADFADL